MHETGRGAVARSKRAVASGLATFQLGEYNLHVEII